jgi:hypothetical protein
MATSSSSSTFSQTANITQSPILLLPTISNISMKLDSTNYLLWKYQITSIFESYSLLDLLDGSVQPPAKFIADKEGVAIENPLYKQWKTRDQALKTLINATLSPSALTLVLAQTTAQGVWQVLERRYTSLSRTHVLSLKAELDRVKKNNDSITVYLDRVTAIRDKLGSVGVLIDDEELLHVVLKGLPPEYDAFCSAMRTRERIISCEELHVLLTSEEESKKTAKESSLELPHMAMTATGMRMNLPTTNTPLPLFNTSWNRGRGGGGRNFNNRGRGRNSNGSSRGGYQNTTQGFNQFFSSPTPQNSSNGYSQRPLCQICGKQGHVALDCFHRMNFAYQGKQPPAKLAAIASTNMSNAIHAPSTSGSTCWVSDTGATDHFTPDINQIPDCHEYQGNDCVTVGNGQSLPITHSRNSQLRTISHPFSLRKILHVPTMSSNLLSVHRFCKDNNASFYFDAIKFHIRDLNSGNLLYKGLSERGLYPIHGTVHPLPSPYKSNFSSRSTTKVSSETWHSRLGHPNSRVFRHVMHSSLNNTATDSELPFCTHCVQGKMH